MDSVENLKQWGTELISKISKIDPSDDDFEKFKALVKEIKTNGELSQPLAESTNYFLNNICKTIVETILAKKVKPNEVKILNPYITKMIPIFIQRLDKFESDFIIAMRKFVENKNRFYYAGVTYNYNHQLGSHFEKNITRLCKKGFVKRLTEICKSEPTPLPNIVYWGTSFVRSIVSIPSKSDITDLADAAGDVYLFYIKTTDETYLRQIDLNKNHKLLTFARDLGPFFSKKLNNIKDEQFQFYINLSLCSIVPKAFDGLGAIYAEIYDSKERAQHLQQIGFLDTILSRPIHHQLANRFVRALMGMTVRGAAGIEHIKKLWTYINTQSGSTADEFIDAFECNFDWFPEGIKKEFWEYLESCTEFKSPALNFLKSKGCQADDGVRVDLTNALISAYKITNEKDELCETITALVPDTESVCDEILDRCIEFLTKDVDVDIALVLFNASVKKASAEKVRENFVMIVTAMGSLDTQLTSQILQGLSSLVIQFDSEITIDEYRALFSLTKDMLERDPKSIFEFFQAISSSNAMDLFSEQMRFELFEEGCKANTPYFEYVVLFFNAINKITTKTKKLPEFQITKGIWTIWDTGIRTNNSQFTIFVSEFLINSKSKEGIEPFIKRAAKSLDNTSALISILHLINFIEATHDKTIIGLKEVHRPSCLKTCKVTLTGALQKEFEIPVSTPFEAFMENIAFGMGMAPDSIIVKTEDGKRLSAKNYSLSDKETFNVKMSSYYTEKYTPLSPNLFPTFFLRPYTQQLYELMCGEDIKKAELGFKILDQMPLIDEIVKEVEHPKWNHTFSSKNPFFTLYKTEVVGNLIESQENFAELFYTEHGAMRIFKFAIERCLETFSSTPNREIVLDTCLYILKKGNEENIAQLADDLGKPLLKAMTLLTLDLVNSESSELDYFMMFIATISEAAPKLFSISTLSKLIKPAVFHTSRIVRKSIVRTVLGIGAEKFKEHIVELLPYATGAYCAHYFQMLEPVALESDCPNEIFDTLKRIVKQRYSPPEDTNQITKLEFEMPPANFTKNLFNLISSLADKVDLKKEKSFFDFIVSNILFNPIKFVDPPHSVFVLIMKMINNDESLAAEVLPKFGEFMSTSKISIKEEKTKYRGLVNQGCTCYMNASLQQLFYSTEYRAAILKPHFDKTSWVYDLQMLWADMLFSPRSYVDTRQFVSTFQWYGENIDPHEQQDAQEFIQLLVDQLNEVIPHSNEVFEGEIEVITKGIIHEFSAQRTETFTTFPLEVKDHTGVEDSLRTFLIPDELTGENQYKADGIGLIDARMYHRLKKAPPILILHLKRFTYNMAANRREKLNSKYSFPLHLDVTHLMTDNSPMSYELTGIIIHSGSAQHGHYYSYAGYGNNWHCFNDTRVSETRLSTISKLSEGSEGTSDNPYILFYRRTDIPVRTRLEIDETIFTQVAGNIEETVRAQISGSELYNGFMTELCTSSNNPEVVFAALTLQPPDEEMMNRVRDTVHKDPHLLMRKQRIKEVLYLSNWASLRQEIAKLVIECFGTLNDAKPYYEFVISELQGMLNKPSKIEEALIPLVPSLEYLSNEEKNNLLEAIITFFRVTVPKFIDMSYKNSIGSMKVGALFDALRELIKVPEFFERISQYVLSDEFTEIAGQIRICSGKFLKLRASILCHDEATFEEFINKAKNSEASADDVADSLALLIASNKDIAPIMNNVKKRDNSFQVALVKAIQQRASPDLQPFFATNKGWVFDWLMSESSDCRANTIKLLYDAFPNAPPAASIQDFDKFELGEQDKQNLELIAANILAGLEKMASLTCDRSNDPIRRKGIPAQDYFVALTWSLLYIDNMKILSGQADRIISAAKKITHSEYYMERSASALISCVGRFINSKNSAEFFGTPRKLLDFIGIYIDNISEFSQDMSVGYTLIDIIPSEFVFNFFDSKSFRVMCMKFFYYSLTGKALADLIKKHASKSNIKELMNTFGSQQVFSTASKQLSQQFFECASYLSERFPEFGCKMYESHYFDRILERLSTTQKRPVTKPEITFLTKIILGTKRTNPKLFAKMQNSLKEHDRCIMNRIKRLDVNDDFLPIVDAFIWCGGKLAEIAMSSIPLPFIKEPCNEEHLSFINSAAFAASTDMEVRKKFLSLLPNMLDSPDGKTLNQWCLSVSVLLDDGEESQAVADHVFDALRKTSDLKVFGSGLIVFCQKCEADGATWLETAAEICSNLLVAEGSELDLKGVKTGLEFLWTTKTHHLLKSKLTEMKRGNILAACFGCDSYEKDDIRNLIDICLNK